MNETIAKFGDQRRRMAEFDHWVVLLRPAQPDLGQAAKLDDAQIAALTGWLKPYFA